MKSLDLKEMEVVEGGSSASTLCFFSTAIWVAFEGSGNINPASRAQGRALIDYCWNS